MNVREQLNRLMKLDALIDRKIEQYDKARRLSATGFYSGRVKMLANDINTDIDRLCDEKSRAMQLIDGTPNLTENEIDILYLHFLEGKSYETIAEELYYAKTTVFKTCKKALSKVESHWSDMC